MQKRAATSRLSSRPLRLGLVLSCAVALVSCASDAPQPARLALIDPLGILDDVTSDLRLLVLPAAGHACSAGGRLDPELPTTPGVPVTDAVVDITFAISAGASVLLDPGTYTVLVRGRGTDPISGVGPNELIATGCQTGVVIAAGETREVSVEMKQIINPGICGDAVLSPDEQCEGTTPSPCMSCKTSAYAVSTTTLNTAGSSAGPAIAFADGARVVAAYDSFAMDDGTGTQKVRMMLLDAQGQHISSPTALALDETVSVGVVGTGIQSQSSAASGSVRLAVAYAGHFVGADPGGDALVRFFDSDRNALGDPATAAGSSTGAQGHPSLAMMTNGTALVAFTNDQSASGASVQLFAAGSTTGAGAAAILGTGLNGIQAPSVAAGGSGFVVAFSANDDVYYQRFGADGTATDADAVLVTADAAGVQSSAKAAALPDGRFSVAFLDATAGKIRARTFDATGTPVGLSMDLSGAGATDLAFAAGHERFAAVWVEAGGVHARLLDGAGQPALNRESMPNGDAFLVASGGRAPVVATGGSASQGLMIVGFITGGALQARLYPIP